MLMWSPAYDSFSATGDWAIMCDFDGTITPFDITDAVLERFADKEWEILERDWQGGRISARQCMEGQIELIKASRKDLDAFLDTVPIREGFPEFIAFCAQRSLRPLVVSDGMDYAIRRVLANHGLGHLPLIANRLLCNGDSSYRLTFPHGAPGCPSGVCKCAVAKACPEPVLLIGDGLSDCCVAGAVTLVLAQPGKALKRTCEQENYPYKEYKNFFDVRAIVEDLLRQPADVRQNANAPFACTPLS